MRHGERGELRPRRRRGRRRRGTRHRSGSVNARGARTAPPSTNGNGHRPVASHDPEIEACLIGAMLLSSQAIEDAAARVDESMFYLPLHGRLFSAIADLWSTGHPVDLATVGHHLRQLGLTDDAAALVGIGGNAESRNGADYADRVAEHARNRALQAAALELGTAAQLGDRLAIAAALDRITDSGPVAQAPLHFESLAD
ncbi:MAG TPA: DnaB-like helicase N-terminal domain-containing protein, partial [Acidimicrobiales bacterium]|nr:DnaB-like helicase N-terminal domain-containing protein [Acidimicrobiales bacterium]